MKDLNPQSWLVAEQKFAEGLGQARVRSETTGLTLLFDLSDAAQREQFERFGKLCGDRDTIYPTTASEGLGVEVFIPHTLQAKNLATIMYIADQMAVKAEQKLDGEIHRPITSNEPEHVLETLTGVPWKHVSGSPYAGEVVEAKLPGEVDENLRAMQEYAVATVVRPDGKTTEDATGWVAHQAAVEKKRGTKPRTAVPTDWVSSSGISRAQNATSMQTALHGVFSKTR